MKILYLSCHEILEYDEVRLFHSLGYDVFSPGAYVEPNNRGDQCLRPSIPTLTYDPDVVEQYHRLGVQHPGEDAKYYLTKEFVDNFDVVIVMHIPRWIQGNWEAIKHKPVIWRTIGQSLTHTEAEMAPYRPGIKIVRYSPFEAHIPGCCGMDALIRFYKDPADYGPWTGQNESVITFAQNMQGRGTACNYEFFEQVTRPFPRKLFGPENHQPGFGMGRVSYPQLKAELCANRVYFYTGTHPASYTLNFIEALMTGIPLVAIGPQHGNADIWRNHNLYEIQNLIINGHNGFISDDVTELQAYIRRLLTEDDLAQQISEEGRKSAIHHFGRDLIASAWKDFLENKLGL